MAIVRSLLAMGNGKLGQSIHHFDLLPVTTCPGRSGLCERVCYAKAGRFRFPQVQERLAWCYEQSQMPDFPEKMRDEIRKKGVLVVRLHVGGDFYDAEYARKWLEVFRRCPKTRFYFYTRSWRVEEVATVLEQMASLDRVRVWYSFDEETGRPENVPEGVRLAFLQETENGVEQADVLFRVRELRDKKECVPLAMICPAELEKSSQGVNCGNCGHCWQ